MTLRLWLVRHGPTHAKTLTGWSDVPADLSDHDALERLDRALPKGAPVVSSDLARARDTADRIAGGRPRWADMAALREMHFGEWEGCAHDDIDPAANHAFWTQPGETAPPGGESWNAFAERVHHGMDAAMTRCTGSGAGGSDLVIVAHFGVILAAIARALDLAPQQAFRLTIDPLSLTRIDRLAAADEGGLWRVCGINQVR